MLQPIIYGCNAFLAKAMSVTNRNIYGMVLINLRRVLLLAAVLVVAHAWTYGGQFRRRMLFVLTNHEHVKVAATNDKPSQTLPTGWYLPECSHPYFEFTKENYEIDFASIEGGYCPVTPSSIENLHQDAMNEGFWKSDRLRRLTERTKAVTACDPADYDGVFFVGGFGTMWDFPFSKPLAEFTQLLHDDYAGLVGAVCHGPIALLNVKTKGGGYLVEGKEVTAFCNEEEKLASSFMVPYFPKHDYDKVLQDESLKTCEDLLAVRGALFRKKEPWTAHVLQADRVFTGQNPASAGPLSQRMLQILEEKKQKK